MKWLKLFSTTLLIALLAGTVASPTSAQAVVGLTVGNSGALSYSEQAAATPIAPSLTLNFSAGDQIASARVELLRGYQQGADVLSIGTATGTSGADSGISWSWNASSGLLTLSGDASTATYQSVLRKVTFRNGSDTPTSAQREVRISVGSGLQWTNSHFYEYVGGSLSWADARAAAAAKRYFGLQGYLVTVTSAAETEFLLTRLGGREAWIGATDSLVDNEWRWVTGPEGREDSGRGRIFSSGSTATSGQYVNWNPGEPNHGGSGSVAYFIREGCNFSGCIPGKWDDIPPTTNAAGYVVEYGGLPGDPTVALADSALVNVTPVNDLPTNITLSAASVGENLPAGTLVGTLGATDPDHTSGFTYALVAGAGDADNAAFAISGAQLRTARTLDFEAKSSLSIRVQVTDPAGGAHQQAFTVAVTDNPLAPTLTSGAPPASAVYGDPYQFAFSATGEPAPAFTVSAGNLPAGLTLSSTGLLSGTLSAAGTYTFTVQAAVAGASPNATRQVVLSVARAPLTIKANDLTVKQTNPVNLTYTITGLKGSDTAAALGTITPSSTGNGNTIGTFPITVAGASSANYAISYAPGTLTVQARDLPVVTWPDPAPILYGTPLGPAQLGAVVANPNAANQTLPGTITYTPPLNTVLQGGNGQRLTLIFTPTDTLNFAPVTVVRTIDVTPVPLIITADDKRIYVGNPLPTLTASYSGFVNGDGPDDLNVKPTLSTPALSSRPGISPIVASGAVDPSYVFGYAPGTMTVLAALAQPQIVSPAPPPGVYGTPYNHIVAAVGNPSTMTYTLIGALPPGLSFDPATARLSGTPTQAGSYPGLTLSASNGIDPVATASYTIMISKAPLLVSADDASRTQGAPNPTLTAHYGGFVLGDDAGDLTPAPSISTPADDQSLAGTYPIELTGGDSINYQLVLLNGTLTVTPQDVPVITWAAPAAIDYSTALSATQLNAAAVCGPSSTPLENGVNAQFFYTPAAGTLLRAGQDRALRVTIVPQIPTCATVTARVDIDVRPLPLTITAPSLTIPAGTALPALTPTFSGLRPGDSGAKLRTPAEVTTAADKNLAGTYPILVSGAADPNYAPITYANGTLTVVAASSTGGVPPSGAPGSVFPYIARGFPPGETVTLTVNGKVVGTATADPDGVVKAAVIFDPQTPAGTYTIKATGAPSGTTTEQPVTIDPSEPLRTDTQGLPPLAARPVAPDSQVPLVAGGFTPGEQVDVTVDGKVIGTLTAGPDGTVRAAIDLEGAQTGTRRLTFTGRSSGVGESAQITVDPNGPTVTDPTAGRPGGPPILGATPGGPGSYFPVTFGGFTPGQQVPLIVDGKPVGTVAAGPDGVVRTAVYLDPNAQPGQHTIQAGPGGPVMQVTVAPDAPSLPAPAGVPVVQGTVEVGAPGGYFPFTAGGFTPGERVTITRDGVVIGTATADASGRIEVAVKFDPSTPEGTYQLKATGASSGVQSTATMQIAANGPERHDPGNVPVLTANPKIYLPIVRR